VLVGLPTRLLLDVATYLRTLIDGR